MASRKSISVINMNGVLGPSILQHEAIKTISETILETYDKENQGQLGQHQVAQIMKDMYRSMNMNYEPTKEEIAQYMRLMDLERTNSLNEKNLERVAKKYLATSKFDVMKLGERKVETTVLGTSTIPNTAQSTARGQENHASMNYAGQNLYSLGRDREEISSSRQRITSNPPVQNINIQFQSGAFNPSTHSSVNSSAPIGLGVSEKTSKDLTTAFTEFDFDQDGMISSFEFQRSVMRYGWKFGINPMKLNLEEVFASADTDSDGLISFSEYSATILKIS
jgi:Ca2+-binding EF-hand superfamily protein